MICFYVGAFILCLIGIKSYLKDFNNEYISRSSTFSIKGIFVILVFCRHFNQYVSWGDNILDKLFLTVDGFLGQLIVVMFLFYSGFGIIKQIQNSRDKYVQAFLKRRLLPVWVKFAICICLFIIVDLVLGVISEYSFLHILLAFTGWTDIGNSNWFMFVVFVLYILIYLSFRRFTFKDIKWNLVIFSLMACVVAILLYIFKKSHWWNTLLCFSLGMWFGYYKQRIDSFMKNNKNYWITFVVLILAFFALWFVHIKIRNLGKGYIFLSLLFALVVVAITMKVQIGNKVLNFFGEHVFSIYILQRIPMMVFQKLITNAFLYFVVCFAITIVIAVGFDYIFNQVKQCKTKTSPAKAKL